MEHSTSRLLAPLLALAVLPGNPYNPITILWLRTSLLECAAIPLGFTTRSFAMTDTKSESMDWTLWFYWIMATTLGWLLGSLLFSGIPIVIAGVAVAAFQWAVLYKRIHKAWRWAIFSSLGWIVGYILFVVFFPADMGFLAGPMLGGSVGIVQWLLLRKEVDWAGWWIIISILAWTTGLVLMPGLLTSGALPGALTGLALVILFRFSPSMVRN